MLATAGQDGQVKVWRVRTGKVLRRFERAHSSGVSSLCFNTDGSQVKKTYGSPPPPPPPAACVDSFKTSLLFTPEVILGSQLLSASVDSTVRVHGLRSGKMLKEYRGHSAAVGRAVYVGGSHHVLSCCANGKVLKDPVVNFSSSPCSSSLS